MSDYVKYKCSEIYFSIVNYLCHAQFSILIALLLSCESLELAHF